MDPIAGKLVSTSQWQGQGVGSSFKDVLCGVCSTLAIGPALASLQIFKSLTFVSGRCKGVHVPTAFL